MSAACPAAWRETLGWSSLRTMPANPTHRRWTRHPSPPKAMEGYGARLSLQDILAGFAHFPWSSQEMETFPSLVPKEAWKEPYKGLISISGQAAQVPPVLPTVEVPHPHPRLCPVDSQVIALLLSAHTALCPCLAYCPGNSCHLETLATWKSN